MGVSITNPISALATIRGWIERAATAYVCVTPVSGIMAAQRDPAVMRALNGADMVVPDGMPTVWAGRWAGAEGIGRVYGPDLMESTCELAAERGWSTFLYGGAPGVAERLASNLEGRFPGIRIAGTHTPPFRELSEGEKADVARAIDASGADIVWVGLSTPKQDLWMADVVDRLTTPTVLVGVGAAFDVHSGLVKRPPAWLGPLGLFWLYRLIQEPRRLWRRYAVDIPQFVAGVLRRRPHIR